MNFHSLCQWAFALAASFAVSLHADSSTADRLRASPPTALDRYITKPDPAFSWRVAQTIKGDGYTTFMVDMISQSWLTTNEVNRPQWQHWLTVVKPDKVTSSIGLLFIGGGGNRTNPPSRADGMITLIAARTGSVVTELRNVPNQPLIFAGEQKGRSEDSLIAYTWDKFLRTGDEKWPARLPMTKAAVRAMDTITALCASEEGGKIAVDKFFVAGGSKRGWTTWTTAAVDSRVVAIAPIVIDLLNIEPSFVHHWKAYGFWAPAIKDYEEARIMEWNGTPEYRALMRIEEPYEYRARLTIPKFIINASGDQFFLPDSSQFYFNDLPGVKYLRYVPNADHGLKDSDAIFTLLACYTAVLNNSKLPSFTWQNEADGTIRVRAADKPSEVKVWQATNENARDFRLMTLGPVWKSSPLSANDQGVIVAKAEKPAKGWTAYFVELTYANGEGAPFKFTTDVRVIPDTYPFEYKKPVPPK
jgi:PhoPQ-activated pathogenicity-related protein